MINLTNLYSIKKEKSIDITAYFQNQKTEE